MNRDGSDRRHWLLVATDRQSSSRHFHSTELFQTRVNDNFWGFSSKTRNRNKLRKGDLAIIYLGGSGGGKVVANCKLASDSFQLDGERRATFGHGELAFQADYGVHLQDISIWPRPVPFNPNLIRQLSFIKNKVRWGTALQGTIIPLPELDYRIILRNRMGATYSRPSLYPTTPESQLLPAQSITALSLLLGNDLLVGKKVHWRPTEEKNPHLLIVGMSGSGKTETLKATIHELRRARIPSIILDLHREYEAVSEQTIDLSSEVKLNPLEILGRSPLTVVYELSAILRSIYRLGDQQEAVLRAALKQSYRERGITSEHSSWSLSPPSFTEIKDILELMLDDKQKRAFVTRLLNRIEPLFDLEVFSRESYFPFHQIVKQSTALQLTNMPNEPVKTALSDFLLRRLWYYTLNLGPTEHLRFFIVIDEAHRLTYENSPLEPFLREARKYGVGVMLSSQRPTDFSESILANVSTIVCLQCPLDKDAKYMAQQLNCHPEEIKTLTKRGEAIVKCTSRGDPLRIQILPLFQRLR